MTILGLLGTVGHQEQERCGVYCHQCLMSSAWEVSLESFGIHF